MEFQLSYFISWKMMLWKCCTQYASTFGKLSSGHRTGKGQFSFQSQRNAIPKNVHTITKLHASHTLVNWCLKSSKPGFNSTWTKNFQMFKLKIVEEPKIRGTRDQTANIHWIIKKAIEFQKNIYFCFIDLSKSLCEQTVENFYRDGNTRPPYLLPEKSVWRSRSHS